MLLELLRGETPAAERELARLRQIVRVEGESVLWYPAAGNDYRDLLEMSRARRAMHRIRTAPNLIVHSDYWEGTSRLDRDVLHQDHGTRVEVEERLPLALRPEIARRFRVIPRCAGLPDQAGARSRVTLALLRVTSHRLGVMRHAILHFNWENLNFLEEVLLPHRVRVTHLVKVREGIGFGGCTASITCAYGWLAELGTEYLISDAENQFSEESYAHLLERFGAPRAFSIEETALITSQWSRFLVRVFKVRRSQVAKLTRAWFDGQMNLVDRTWRWCDDCARRGVRGGCRRWDCMPAFGGVGRWHLRDEPEHGSEAHGSPGSLAVAEKE